MPLSTALRTWSCLALIAFVGSGCGGSPASIAQAPWRSVDGGDAFGGAEFLDVARAERVIVAVGRRGGADGGAWMSPDGLTWTAAGGAPFAGVEVASVTSFPGGFVAVGSRVGAGAEEGAFEAWTSADGLTWSLAPEHQAAFAARSVTAGGPGVVAVGSALVDVTQGTYDGRAASSADGITWVPAEEAAFQQSIVGDVASTPKGLIAVGSTSGVSPANAVVWTSADGQSWTRLADDPAFAAATMSAVAVGSDRIVAVGSSGVGAAVWTSADGASWERIPDSEVFKGAQMTSIAAARGGFLAVGYGQEGAVVWYSPDGSNWSRDPALPDFAESQMFSVIAGTPSLIVGRAIPSRGTRSYVWLEN